jgi:uncharacterized protein (TIGR02996 family)
MGNDSGFLAQLMAEPGDDATRLVYADWLDEQGDPVAIAKAEFLRLTVVLVASPGKEGEEKRKRLQQLAAELDTDWLAVVSRLAIENCSRKQREEESRTVRRFRVEPGFGLLCDRHWEDLQTTGDQAVRFCDACKQDVHYCDTITEAREHAWAGHCIALDLGVIRRDGDLEPQRHYLGQPSEETLRQEEERMKPDPVSAERERRKREKEAGTSP